MSILLLLQGPVEVNLSAAILEGSDNASATVGLAISLSAAILEGSDVVAATVDVTDAVVNLSADILEGPDSVNGTIEVVIAPASSLPGGSSKRRYKRPPTTREILRALRDEERRMLFVRPELPPPPIPLHVRVDSIADPLVIAQIREIKRKRNIGATMLLLDS